MVVDSHFTRRHRSWSARSLENLAEWANLYGEEGNIVNYSDSEFPSNRIAVAPMFRMHSTYDIAPDWSIELSARMASLKYASRPSIELPDQSGQFKGRLLTGNLSFGVARAIR